MADLTRAAILALPAGPALDARVAERDADPRLCTNTGCLECALLATREEDRTDG